MIWFILLDLYFYRPLLVVLFQLHANHYESLSTLWKYSYINQISLPYIGFRADSFRPTSLDVRFCWVHLNAGIKLTHEYGASFLKLNLFLAVSIACNTLCYTEQPKRQSICLWPHNSP